MRILQPPTVERDGVTISKAVSEWSPTELEKANFNSKAIHAIFNAVSMNQMKVIANCEIAKEGWDKLQTKNEGTQSVKKSRLRILTTDFENLVMNDDETVADFHAKICDIANESYALGESYSNAKLVRKVLGALSKKFKSKVTSIEECRDVETLDLDELIGSLQTYEMTLKRWKKEKKEKPSSGMALIHSEEHFNVDMLKNLDEEKVVLLTKNYAKFLRKNMKNNNVNKEENSRKPINYSQRQNKPVERKNKGIQCRECEGYGHIQAECANTLKKKSKALAVTWSDSDLEEDCNEADNSDQEKDFIAFVASTKHSSDAEDEGGSSESDTEDLDQQTAYEQMYEQWLTMVKQLKGMQVKNGELEQEKRELNSKIDSLSKEVAQKQATLDDTLEKLRVANKSLDSLMGGTNKLNQVLEMGKPFGDRTGIGYHNSKQNISEKASTSKAVSFNYNQLKSKVDDASKFIPICHFCGRKGHIRPRCFKLQFMSQTTSKV